MKEEFKTVATFNNVVSARIVAEMLIANGIPAAVLGESSPYPSLGFTDLIEVKVDAADYETAKSLVAASDNAE